jgi:serine/threonine protein kinase
MLASFLAGIVSDEELDRIAQHLESCQICIARSESLHATDPLVAEIAQGRADIAPAAASLIQRLQDVIDESRHSTLHSNIDRTNAGIEDGPGVGEYLKLVSPPDDRNEIGRIGEFRLLRLLGKGGMGAVFLAEDLQLERLCALKLLRPDMARHKNASDRFLREARAAAAVRHENVVTIFQVGRINDVPFLAQEYLEGETLESRIRREGAMPVAEFVRIGRQIAAGLAAAHSKGLLHRDIKPSNIWLAAPRGDVKLLDFGLARAQGSSASRLTHTGTLIGTPAYMSPEQAAGREIDARSDLFSLGCVLYEMATGKRAFARSNVISTLAALASEEPPEIQTFRSDFIPEVGALITDLLAKDSTKRPKSSDVIFDLLALQERKLEPPKSNNARSYQSAAAALLLVVMLSLTFALWQFFRTPPAELANHTDNRSPPAPAVQLQKRQLNRRVAEWVLSNGGQLWLYDVQYKPGIAGTIEQDIVSPGVTRIEDYHDDAMLRGVRLGKLPDAEMLSAFQSLNHLELLIIHNQQHHDGDFDRLFSSLPAPNQLKVLQIFDKSFNDSHCRQLGRFQNLQFLFLQTSATDLGMLEIGSLPEVTQVDVWSCPEITGKGLRIFQPAKLRTLAMTIQNNLDETSAYISECKELVKGHFYFNAINDSIFKALNGLPAVHMLSLALPAEKDVEKLRLPTITHFVLNYTPLTRAGSRVIANWDNVGHLHLWKCEVNDGAMDLLSESKLKLITIEGGSVSRSEVARFHFLKPNVLYRTNSDADRE